MLVEELFIKPRRFEVYSEEDVNYYLSIYNGKKDLYRTVYAYKDSVDVDNVIVDKIFLDIDFDSNMKFLNDVRVVAQFLYDNDYIFYIRFSGNGFHLFIMLDDTKLENPKVAIRQFVNFLHNKTNTESDMAVVGDLRRVTRMPNTLNMKHKEHYYCIPLTLDELLDMSYEDIRCLAKQPRLEQDFINGHRTLNISSWDHVIISEKCSEKQNIVINNEINDDIPPCIHHATKDPTFGYAGRVQLILFFRDLGYTKEEVDEILYSFLSEEKYNHSTYDEKQIEHLFEKDYIFSDCLVQKQNGFCTDDNCKGHGLYF